MEYFSTRTIGELDPQLFPMQLWKKAKQLGIWNPDDIDFSEDEVQWKRLDSREQDLVLRFTAQFKGSEESVVSGLLPLLQLIVDEGRLEEELFLTACLWEEAKHVEGFHRFLSEVAAGTDELEHFYTPAYRHLFFRELPQVMGRLWKDDSPVAQAKAAVTYQLIIEGTLGETAYRAYHAVLEANDLLPGMQLLVRRIQQDEARHVTYGLYLLSRLVAEYGNPVWDAIEIRVQRVLPMVMSHIHATFAPYSEDVPFGIKPNDFLQIGMSEFQKRYDHIRLARQARLEDVLYNGVASSESAVPVSAGT